MSWTGNAAKRSTEQEDGYSLIELLMVILIIGILAAIVIPSFLGQRTKAQDAQAKELVRTAQTTAESIATDHGGNYANVSLAELKSVEPSIVTTASSKQAYLSGATGSSFEYSVTVTAPDGNEFTISRSAEGATTRKCTSTPGQKLCGGSEASSW